MATRAKGDLDVEYVDLGELHVDPVNARAHDERNLAAIKASLTAFGQRKPIVARRDGMVVAGNGTLEAARSLGWPRLAVVWLPFDEPDRVRAYALADNRTAELASWDDALLLDSLSALQAGEFDLASVGFSEADLVAIQARLDRAGPPDDFDEFDDDLATEFVCPRCGYEWSGRPNAGGSTNGETA